MKQSFKKFGLLACLILVAACDRTPNEVYVDRGDPERLIDHSSETVTLSLKPKNALTKLAEMVAEDRPSSAQLKCSFKSARCTQAKEIFERNGVQINLTSEQSNRVVLHYERVVTRDCNPHFIDNMEGNRSFNHPSFGCAVSANMVQMVSDKHQFTNPALMDYPDAVKAEQNYRGYLQSSATRQVKKAEWSMSSSGR